MKYPKDAQNEGREYKVYMAFIVSKSGKLIEINVVKEFVNL